MKFTTEFLEDVDIIHEEIIDQRRWETTTEIIFEHEGKFYKAFREDGNTEEQESPGFGEEGEEQECHEVHQVEKLVKVWEVIEQQ